LHQSAACSAGRPEYEQFHGGRSSVLFHYQLRTITQKVSTYLSITM
jgi:hypothetical protein